MTLRVRIDPSRCQGYGMCVEFASAQFSYDDWGFAQSIDRDVPQDAIGAVAKAIRQCPIAAIRWAGEPPDVIDI
jgi:ferredoxin